MDSEEVTTLAPSEDSPTNDWDNYFMKYDDQSYTGTMCMNLDDDFQAHTAGAIPESLAYICSFEDVLENKNVSSVSIMQPLMVQGMFLSNTTAALSTSQLSVPDVASCAPSTVTRSKQLNAPIVLDKTVQPISSPSDAGTPWASTFITAPLSASPQNDDLPSPVSVYHPSSVTHSPCDLHEFTMRATPPTEQESSAIAVDKHSNQQHFSSMPCWLPWSDTYTTSNAEEKTLRPLYNGSESSTEQAPVAVVDAPVVIENDAEPSMTNVSNAMPLAMLPKTSVSVVLPPGSDPLRLQKTQKMYECPKCYRMFVRAYNLKKHMETHEAFENRVRPFKCPFDGCGKSFCRKHDMNRHYTGVHFGIRKTHTSDHSDSADGARATNLKHHRISPDTHSSLTPVTE